MKGAKKVECKGGVQKVECKRGECRGVSAGRQPETHLNTLVGLRPRADSIAHAHSAGPRFYGNGLWGCGVVGSRRSIQKSK